MTDEYDFIDHEETALSPEVLAQIRDWLQPTDYLAESGEFRRHLSSKAPGTGLWICETDDYRKWHDSADHGSLFIKGVPGAGKSVMAASIIHHLRTTEQCPVLFFFFRNIVAANFSPRALIQDWLAQLLPHSPKLQFGLQSRLGTSLAETSDNDLIQIFLDGVACVPKVYCVGDALDEMTTDNGPFLQKLNGMATYRPRSLKLLMTSRPKQHLQRALRDSSIVHINLQRRLVDADIISYLHCRFDGASRLQDRQEIKQQVINMVAKRSEGLFLYAKLTMDEVEAVLSTDDLVDITGLEGSLPVGLEKTYSKMLAKQRENSGVDTDMQLLVLEAITHASRPLRLNELASLIRCVCPDATAPTGFKALITTCCGPLVEVLEDETLQVIHHSFTEFLRGDTRNILDTDAASAFPVIDPNKAHKRMAINCLKYLQSGSLLLEDELQNGSAAEPLFVYQTPRHLIDPDKEHYERSHLGLEEERDPFNYRQARLSHPFLGYAVENWSHHASRYDVQDNEFFTAVIEFLESGSLAFQRWLVLQWGTTSNSKGSMEGVPTALHISSFAGLSKLALELMQKGSSVSAVDAQERIPLHWAAANGHAEVASLLIKHGSDPNAEDGRGLKPIHLAARKNHALVVKVMLEAGVEPDTIKTRENHAGRLLGGEKTTRGECAILYASQRGHTETVITMIPFCEPKILEQLLCECCRFNRTDAVLAILNRSGVSANATYRGATVLYFACATASVQCAEALINRGADVCKTSKWTPRRIINGSRREETMKSPLHRLITAWGDDNNSACRAILRMLIEAGAEIEQLDGDGNTALLMAAGAVARNHGRSLHVPAMRALLEAGADVQKANGSGDTALHLLLGKACDPEAVRLLIEYGSDPNQRGSAGKTALQLCMHQCRPNSGAENTPIVVKYLLENGADPNCRDNHGGTALYQAMFGGLEVFQILLPKCNDDAVKRKCWFRLADEHSTERFVKYLELLLAEGIDIDTRARNGLTLYLCCLKSDEKLRILRSYGATADIADTVGNNALHILCRSNTCMRDRLEKLIADGVDPLSTNNNGDTLLHHVASWYNNEQKTADYVRWLVSLRIPVNAQNNEGLTALHVAHKTTSLGSSLNNGGQRIHFIHAINDRSEVNFEIRDNNGLTALHMAAMRSEVAVATLVAAGADPGFLTGDLQNVLHLSCRARKPSLVSQILDQTAGVDLNQKDRFGRTPLHYACSSGEPESVAFLLKHGADVHAVDLDGSTPLHACAQYRSEQNIWDVQGQGDTWLQGPPQDSFRFRLGFSRLQPYEGPWYHHQHNAQTPITHKSFLPALGAIVKMVLDANCDAAATNKFHATALDVALYSGCAEFVEIFAADETLFAQATKRLEDDKENGEHSAQTRHRIKAQMTLIRPRSSFDILTEDISAFNEVLKAPSQYLELLTCDDAVTVITEGLKANPLDSTYYKLLDSLLKPGHLQVVERLPHLVLLYSSFVSLADMIERIRKTGKSYRTKTTLTALQLACERPESNMLMLEFLVGRLHVDVNAQCALLDGDPCHPSVKIVPGGTALHLLASADNHWQLEGLKFLLATGADVNALDENGQSPIHIAAHGIKNTGQNARGFWRLNAIRILLDHGADPNILDKQGLSPLHKACAAPEIMRELLYRGADTTIGTRSPMFVAISDQCLSALEILLDHGLSVDSLDEKCHSRDVHYSLTKARKVYALLCTAFAPNLNTQTANSVPLFRTLVERGADLYQPLNDDEAMIHFLFEYPEHEVLDTLLQEPCLSRIDFNRRDQRGRTVLMAACDWRQVLPGYFHRHWDSRPSGPPLRILDQKADATLVDNAGKTALHHLMDNPGMPDDVLLQFIDREEVAPTRFLKDADGYSPFHYALRTIRPQVCELLLFKGANLLEPDPNGLTVLHYIATQWQASRRSVPAPGRLAIDLPKDHFDRCLALWQRFLAEGGSINVTDNAGNTPLHTFLLSPDKEKPSTDSHVCHLEHYNKLFPPGCGVDIFAVNREGETALHMITRREKTYYTRPGHDKALFETMMGKGLDPLEEDCRGSSALDVASACGKDDIVALLGRK